MHAYTILNADRYFEFHDMLSIFMYLQELTYLAKSIWFPSGMRCYNEQFFDKISRCLICQSFNKIALETT